MSEQILAAGVPIVPPIPPASDPGESAPAPAPRAGPRRHPKTLRSVAAGDPDLQLVLRSDDDGEYQGFVSALSAAREAGIHAIATDR